MALTAKRSDILYIAIPPVFFTDGFNTLNIVPESRNGLLKNRFELNWRERRQDGGEGPHVTAKEYLQQVKLKEAKIKNLRRDKESLEGMLYSLGGVGRGECVQSTRNIDKFGTLYGLIDEAERKIEKQIADLIQSKIEVSKQINEIYTGKYMILLNCRYIHFMS